MTKKSVKTLLHTHSNCLWSGWKDVSTHKIYPFYIHSCLSKSPADPFDLVCQRCGHNEQGNHVVKCGIFVFQASDQVELYCSPGCMPAGCIAYENQVYGFSTPVQLSESLAKSLLHKVVWNQCSRSMYYKLRAYRGKHITVEMLKADFDFKHAFFPESHGHGSKELSWENKHGTISVWDKKSPYKSEDGSSGKQQPDLLISPGMIAAALMDILRPEQLSLF